MDPARGQAGRRRAAPTGRSRPRGGGRCCRFRRCAGRTGHRGSAEPWPSIRGASRGSRRPTAGSATSGSGEDRRPSRARNRPGRACRARPHRGDRPAGPPGSCQTGCRNRRRSRPRSTRCRSRRHRRVRGPRALPRVAIISSMCSVARGKTCAGRMLTRASSAWNAASYASAISAVDLCSRPACTSIRSSPRSNSSSRRCPTSVMFLTWNTSMPWYSSTRRMRSASRFERRFPTCAKRYTVGPHVYIRTRPGSSGSTASTDRVSVFRMRNVIPTS